MRFEIRIVLEVVPPLRERGEAGLRVMLEDAPLYFGPETDDGRKVALDAVRRALEVELDRLAETAGSDGWR